MADRSQLNPVQQAARGYALDWLHQNGYCDCALQVQLVARRLEPVVGMFEREIRRGSVLDQADVAMRLRNYQRRATMELARGLHVPGASAALSEERRERSGIDPYC